jgi:pentatricopeptide repeat protein
MQAGDTVTFLLTMVDRQPLVLWDADRAWAALQETDRWWREWSSRIEYDGPEKGALVRSLITLRLLTYVPSGAPVAAPTTSLPETIGGIRNWDYRFAWPRDASIGVAAFLTAGLEQEAHSFMHWLLHAGRLSRPRIQVLYTLDGKPGTREHEVPQAEGYRASRPVRVGNEASTQHQLDVYGWVVDAAWLMVARGRGLHAEMWRAVQGAADFVAAHWSEPDAGIWEIRGDPAHHVHSKLMGWLALDRAIRTASLLRARASRVDRWRRERESLAYEVRRRGYDEQQKTYTRAYGSPDLDAATLVLPVLDFEDPSSPRVAGTVDAIRRELTAGDPLLYRYTPETDGLEGREGAFLPCTFWLIQALARIGRVEEARELFHRACSLGGPLGLLPEEIDPSTGEYLGNYPQALSHAALVQAALALATV